jgi:hypothetical protein
MSLSSGDEASGRATDMVAIRTHVWGAENGLSALDHRQLGADGGVSRVALILDALSAHDP